MKLCHLREPPDGETTLAFCSTHHTSVERHAARCPIGRLEVVEHELARRQAATETFTGDKRFDPWMRIEASDCRPRDPNAESDVTFGRDATVGRTGGPISFVAVGPPWAGRPVGEVLHEPGPDPRCDQAVARARENGKVRAFADEMASILGDAPEAKESGLTIDYRLPRLIERAKELRNERGQLAAECDRLKARLDVERRRTADKVEAAREHERSIAERAGPAPIDVDRVTAAAMQMFTMRYMPDPRGAQDGATIRDAVAPILKSCLEIQLRAAVSARREPGIRIEVAERPD